MQDKTGQIYCRNCTQWHLGYVCLNGSPSLYLSVFRGKNATRMSGDPNGIRTRVTPVKGECPRPLDDRVSGGKTLPQLGMGFKLYQHFLQGEFFAAFLDGLATARLNGTWLPQSASASACSFLQKAEQWELRLGLRSSQAGKATGRL